MSLGKTLTHHRTGLILMKLWLYLDMTEKLLNVKPQINEKLLNVKLNHKSMKNC